jgi:predicted MPP superfamily phosphohydrolase
MSLPKLFAAIVIFLLILMAKAYYDTNSIEIKHYQVKNSALGEALGGLTVAHLSDIHMKDMGPMANKIIDILKSEKPDLIFITGDLISFEGSYQPVMSFLQQLHPPYGTYGVLGNAEYSNENGSCILCHEERSKRLRREQSWIFLRDSFSSFKINGKILNIIGVDDPVQKRSHLKKALEGVNPNYPSVLLAHSPEIFEEASSSGIDLLLCGHTHGGQIFLTRYLRKILPLEASLEFIEGFYQKGKMLMYVNRGIGASFIPFRFGVKPEITFFKFSTSSMNPSNSSNPTNPSNPIDSRNTVSISNNPPDTIFAGLSLSSLIETFDVLQVFESLRMISTRPQHRSTAAPQHRSTLTNPSHPTDTMNSMNPANPRNLKIFDFESEEELKKLRWECHKWFELSEENATSGKYALKVTLPPGQYSGVDFLEIASDWSGFRYLKLDFFNPSKEGLPFHIRIDDNKSGWEYANRFDIDFDLSPGMNHLSIPTDSIQTNMRHRPLNLGGIRRMMVFIPENFKRRDLYIDHIRLE